MALKLNWVFAELKPPAAEKKLMTWAACSVPPDPVTATASLLSPAFEPAGKVTPVADTDTWPVPSESIVAPPKLIVWPVRNNSANLFVALPKFLVPSPSGNISWSTADHGLHLVIF